MTERGEGAAPSWRFWRHNSTRNRAPRPRKCRVNQRSVPGVRREQRQIGIPCLSDAHAHGSLRIDPIHQQHGLLCLVTKDAKSLLLCCKRHPDEKSSPCLS